MNSPKLIVMLTKNDFTVSNADEIFELCKDSNVKCWGAKEDGISEQRLISLFDSFHKHNKTTFLEVVSYDESEGIRCAKLATKCKCDFLLGTKFYKSIADICNRNNIKYMPFVGNVRNRPSLLSGEENGILSETEYCIKNGAYGIDLLGYRYCGDGYTFSKNIVSKLNIPVCLAGSIDSFERIDQVLDISPVYFTIGGAFFDDKFGNDFYKQIELVYNYINNKF